MDSSSHHKNREIFALFPRERTQCSEYGSDRQNRPKPKPGLLTLFPLTPTVRPRRKDSMKGLWGQDGQQMREDGSGTGTVVNRTQSKRRPLDQDHSALMFSTLHTPEHVAQETTHRNPFKAPRKELSFPLSEAPSFPFIDTVCHQASFAPFTFSTLHTPEHVAQETTHRNPSRAPRKELSFPLPEAPSAPFIDTVCHQSSFAPFMFSTLHTPEHVAQENTHQNPSRAPRKELSFPLPEAPSSPFIETVCHQSSFAPSVSPSNKFSPKGKGKRLQAVRELIGSEPRSTYLDNGTSSTSATRKSNRSGSASSSRAAVKTVSPLLPILIPLEQETVLQMDVDAVGMGRRSARHGPRPKSSPFRGVTHYKRTGRWEAHIWSNGRQLYLGASSTAQKAARAYDRAAIHFRRISAELNFYVEDYAEELRRLVELSENELVAMLRKQSVGEGSLHPEYPPIKELGHPPLLIMGAPINLTAMEEASQEEHHSGHVLPEYPPIKVLGHPPLIMRAPINLTAMELASQQEHHSGPVLESISHGTHANSRILNDSRSRSSSVGNMVQSDQPQGQSTFHVPQAAHVYQRRGQYLQIIDKMADDLQIPGDWLKLS